MSNSNSNHISIADRARILGQQRKGNRTLRDAGEAMIATGRIKGAEIAPIRQQSLSENPPSAFTVTVDVPPSLNSTYANIPGKGRILTAKARIYKASASEAVTNAAIVQRFKCPADARLALRLKLYFPNNRRRDISNTIKSLEDVLASSLGFDDSRIDRLLVERAKLDANGARCEVELAVIG